MKESDIQKACLDYLKLKGIFCWKAHSGGIYDPKRGVFRKGTSVGIPDICCVLAPYGVFCGFEVKTPKGKLSDAQRAIGEQIEAAGGYYAVVRSVDELAEDIQTIIEELSKK